MGKGYSQDLRERVVARVGAGVSRRQAAKQFAVSESCAIKLMQRFEATGSVEPARQGRPPGDGKLAAHVGFLIGWVERQPDVTMPELAQKLAEQCEVTVSPQSISRVLCKAGFTYKKNSDGYGARTRGRSPAPH
jgi:transposase